MKKWTVATTRIARSTASQPFRIQKNWLLLVKAMGFYRAAAILALDDRFSTWSLELKCVGTSLWGTKQKFLIPQDSTWRRVIKAHRPFAARDHMVQNTPNWSAKECARLRDKTQLTSKV